MTPDLIARLRAEDKRLRSFGAPPEVVVKNLPTLAGQAATALETLTARIAELEAERAWRPIETAPRDGTMFLARGKVYGNIPFACHWDVAPLHPNGSWINSLTKSRLYDHVPAHWQPLPPLPTPETGDG